MARPMYSLNSIYVNRMRKRIIVSLSVQCAVDQLNYAGGIKAAFRQYIIYFATKSLISQYDITTYSVMIDAKVLFEIGF